MDNLGEYGIYDSFEENQLTNNEMQNVYKTLSVSDNSNVDVKDDLEFVQHCIEECFDQNFRMIETSELQSNSLLLNKKFLELVMFCKSKHFKKTGYIFIGFCDYFDLNGNKVYNELHEKLQNLIQYSAKCLCKGTYEKVRKKSIGHDVYVPTLFDLLKK